MRLEDKPAQTGNKEGSKEKNEPELTGELRERGRAKFGKFRKGGNGGGRRRGRGR